MKMMEVATLEPGSRWRPDQRPLEPNARSVGWVGTGVLEPSMTREEAYRAINEQCGEDLDEQPTPTFGAAAASLSAFLDWELEPVVHLCNGKPIPMSRATSCLAKTLLVPDLH